MNIRLSTALLGLAAVLAAPCRADGNVILDFHRNEADRPGSPRVAADGSFHILVDLGPYALPTNCGFFRMAADGTLISTFGNQGRLASECARDFAVRPDGSMDMLDASGLHLQFRNPAGSLISTSGRVFPTGAGDGFKTGARALLPLSTGKFMVGGYYGSCLACDPGDLDWAVARLNADGTIDNSFANGLALKPSSTDLLELVELPDGKVLGAGRSVPIGQGSAFSRFDSVGVDFTYGLNAETSVATRLGTIAPDSTGRIYMLGSNSELVRLNTDGTVDATFPTILPAGDAEFQQVVLDSQGRILLFGGTGAPAYDAYIVRYLSTGALDTAFNGSGAVTYDFSDPSGKVSLVYGCTGALRSQDRPLLACMVENRNGGDLGVASFSEAGQLDVSFGANQADTDLYPDAITIPDVSAPYGAIGVVSAPVTVGGFDAGRETSFVSLGGVDISVGCNGTWVTKGLIQPGETFCARTDASTTPGGSVERSINVGGRVATFTVISTNTAADAIPDQFTFAAQTNVALDTMVTSNRITVTGITGRTTATVINGFISQDCDLQATSSSLTYITNGMEMCVRHMSSAQNSTTVTTTLTIGGVSASFSSTTLAAASSSSGGGSSGGGSGSSSGGGSGGGGALDQLLLAALGLCLALSWLNRRPRRAYHGAGL